MGTGREERDQPGREPLDPVAPEGESDTIRRPEAGSSGTSVSSLARVIRQASPYIAASWVMTAALLLGALGGRWLDQRFGTRPLLAMLGLFLGLAVGLYELARVIWRNGAKKEP